jgi:hypothetical protein
MNRIATTLLATAGTGTVLLMVAANVSAVAPRSTCPEGLPGPGLVFIPAGTASFCIDAREVKLREYAEFLEVAKSKPPKQSEECTWNDRLSPSLTSPGDDAVPRVAAPARLTCSTPIRAATTVPAASIGAMPRRTASGPESVSATGSMGCTRPLKSKWTQQ